MPLLSGCQSGQPPVSNPQTQKSTETDNRPSEDVTEAPVADDAQIVAFCGGCHAMPSPLMFPKSAWYDEVKRGFNFSHQFKRKELVPPKFLAVVDYFRSRAPESMDVPPDKSAPPPAWARFRTEEIFLAQSPNEFENPIAVSFVGKFHRTTPGKLDLLLSDMANGGIYLANISTTKSGARRLAKLINPAAICQCDLNGNGKPDIVCADLGSFVPSDHDHGSVVWLPDVEGDQTEAPAVQLIENLGRVADVQPADFDGDGDIDLIVAEFGWHHTGRLLLLRNEGDRTAPRFTEQVIDPRPGAIHVPVVDLNRDGKPDFIALISQEFEAIEAFIGQGDGTFQKQTIHGPGDPAFGSSGIQVVDLDGDGDDDVLYTNGDFFDSFLIKPYHGIQWLENRGQFPFVLHRLTSMPGVHRALAGDLDRDGDLDIVACAMFPSTIRDTEQGRQFDSLILLEQTRPGEFTRFRLETGNNVHAAMEMGDFDGDGDPDLAVGSFRLKGTSDQSAITIWWNDSAAVPKASPKSN